MRADRRERVGWYLYDWANSAFSATVLGVFAGPYLTALARGAADSGGFVYPLGLPVYAASLFPYAVSLGVLLQVLWLPVLGAIADHSGAKRLLLGVFAGVGALATAGFYVVTGSGYLLGVTLFVVATVAHGASTVVYNALLPDIAGPDERDTVSSIGWGVGYLGGGFLLALNLVLVARASALGLTQADAARLSLASAGLWWGLFTVPTVLWLRGRPSAMAGPRVLSHVVAGLGQLRDTLGRIRQLPQTLLFLVAFLLYNDGIQTVFAVASQFGAEELGLPLATLTQVILMVQFVACLGSLSFDHVARRLGTKRAVVVSLLVWTGAVVYAYAWLRTAGQFFLLGGVTPWSRAAARR